MNSSIGNVFEIRNVGFPVLAADSAKTLFILFLCIFLIPASQAEEAAGLRQDFENRLPGQTPEGWVKSWGGPLLEDVFTTSNIDALSGKQSILLDRRPYEKPAMYGLAKLAPRINTAAAKIVIPFLLKAPTAYGAAFIIMLRSTKSSMCDLAEFRVGGGKAIFCKVKKLANLGSVEFGIWHRLVVILPLEAGKGNSGSAVLERKQKDGTWTPCAETAEVDVLFSIAPDRRLSIQLVPGSTGEFQLFIDDFVVEPVEGL